MMTAAQRTAAIIVQSDKPRATIPTAYGRKTREGISALIEDQMTDNQRTIQRAEFEDCGWRTIELARGEVVFPDGRKARFNVRLQAQPGSDGEITLIAEDINRTSNSTTTRKLRRAK